MKQFWIFDFQMIIYEPSKGFDIDHASLSWEISLVTLTYLLRSNDDILNFSILDDNSSTI